MLIQQPMQNFRNQVIERLNLIEDAQNLDQWKEQIIAKLKIFQNLFYDGMDTTSKIRLGWFSNKSDQISLQKAKDLVRRGYNVCHDLQKQVHDELRNFKIQDFKLSLQALKMDKPIQKSWGKVFTIAAVLQEICFLSFAIYTKASFLFCVLGTISIAAVSFVLTMIYEGKKVSNHRKIIDAYLNMEKEILKLESFMHN